MAKLSLRMVIGAVDRATAPLRKVERAVRAVGRATGLDQVGRAAGRVGRQLVRVGNEASRFARRTGLAAIASGAAAFSLTGRFAAAGDNIAKTAERLGLGVVELQRWRYAAEKTGTSQETFDMAVQRFTRRVAEAAAGTGEAKDALKEMGIHLVDSYGKIRPTNELLYDVSDALSKIEDPAQRNRIAMRLFDSEGVKLGVTLEEGKKAMRAYGDEAERLGVITEAQTRAAVQLTDDLTAMRRAVSFLGHTISAELLPFMTPLIREARDFAVAVRPDAVRLMRSVMRDLGGAVRWLRSGWTALRRTGGRWLGWLEETFPPVRRWIAMGREWLGDMGLLRLAALALGAALGFRLLRAVLGLFGPLARLGFALAAAGARMLWLAGVGVVKAVAGLVWLSRNFRFAAFAAKYFLATAAASAFAKVASGFRAAGRAARGLNRIMMRNPILLIGFLIAAAALLIYRYWDDIAAWFGRQWKAIEAAVPVGAWIEELKGFSLWGALTGWWSGVTAWFGRQWAALKGMVPVGAWIAELKGFSLWGALTGWWSGIVVEFQKYWSLIEGAFDLASLRAMWEDFDRWLRRTVRSMTDWMPDWIKKRLGISVSATASNDNAPRPAPAPSIFDRRQPAYSGAGPGELAAARFQGELRIVIDQQGRARVRELRSDNRDIDLVAETGFSMASP